jgi:hypothetical protein
LGYAVPAHAVLANQQINSILKRRSLWTFNPAGCARDVSLKAGFEPVARLGTRASAPALWRIENAEGTKRRAEMRPGKSEFSVRQLRKVTLTILRHGRWFAQIFGV